jgi:hypothetical protein
VECRDHFGDWFGIHLRFFYEKPASLHVKAFQVFYYRLYNLFNAGFSLGRAAGQGIDICRRIERVDTSGSAGVGVDSGTG